VPDEAEEAVRDLVRCREDVRRDVLRWRHRRLKFLDRHGHLYVTGKNWTQRHWGWIRQQHFERPALQADERSPRRWPWAQLLHRVFGFTVLVCDRCGGPRRILGVVTEPAAVRRVLVALGLGAEPLPGDAVPAA
jgi:hypothetical protein